MANVLGIEEKKGPQITQIRVIRGLKKIKEVKNGNKSKSQCSPVM